jgi:hypothetical protein
VQPRAVTPERDQVRERKFIVIEVPHRSDTCEPSLTVGLVPRRAVARICVNTPSRSG